MQEKEKECHPAQNLISSTVSKDESPYDNYKPYPVQQKIDKTDPLYEEFLKQQETDQAARAASTQPPEDVNTYDAKKATQFGAIERVKDLVESGHDVNELDSDGVSLLHWAAINNRKSLAILFIDRGAIVDKFGGTLNSTPLHWATRQGHLGMVVLLMKYGADPTAVDGEGYQAVHLATMFSHSSIVAYLVAKGYDVDTPDRQGMTPLMWACYRTSSMDPTRLLITMGADVNKKDLLHQHTPLHWAMLVGNHTALNLLTKQNVDLNALNGQGQTSLDVAIQKKNRWLIEKIKRARLQKGFDSNGEIQRRTIYNKSFKEAYMIAYPFFLLWAVGWAFEADYWWCYWWARLLLLGAAFLTYRYSQRYLFDERLANTIPFGLYMATKFWMYFTWFFYSLPYITNPALHLVFFINTAGVTYYYYKAVHCDPGYIKPTRIEQQETILDLAEKETIKLEQFCSTCLIQKPQRSKHCSICDRCVAKFDHHCPWIFNCVGWHNLKYFLLYLVYLIGMILWCMYGCIAFWQFGCHDETYTGGKWSLVKTSIRCSPWVTWIFINCCFHLLFVGVLLANQLYQVMYLGLTTNERINVFRYTQFSRDGKFHNPYHRGYVQNCVDEMGWRCNGLCRPAVTNWKSVYIVPGQQESV